MQQHIADICYAGTRARSRLYKLLLSALCAASLHSQVCLFRVEAKCVCDKQTLAAQQVTTLFARPDAARDDAAAHAR